MPPRLPVSCDVGHSVSCSVVDFAASITIDERCIQGRDGGSNIEHRGGDGTVRLVRRWDIEAETGNWNREVDVEKAH